MYFFFKFDLIWWRGPIKAAVLVAVYKRSLTIGEHPSPKGQRPLINKSVVSAN